MEIHLSKSCCNLKLYAYNNVPHNKLNNYFQQVKNIFVMHMQN